MHKTWIAYGLIKSKLDWGLVFVISIVSEFTSRIIEVIYIRPTILSRENFDRTLSTSYLRALVEFPTAFPLYGHYMMCW